MSEKDTFYSVENQNNAKLIKDDFNSFSSYETDERLRTNTTEWLVRRLKHLDLYYHEDYLKFRNDGFGHFNSPSTPVIYGIYGHHGHADGAIARYALKVLTPNLVFAAAGDHWTKNALRKIASYVTVATFNVERNRQIAKKSDLDIISNYIENNFSVAIFVEGSRQADPHKPLKDRTINRGAAYAAIKAHEQLGFTVPIVPVYLHNTNAVMGKKTSLPNIFTSKQINTFVGKPIYYERGDYHLDDNRASKELHQDYTREIMLIDEMVNPQDYQHIS